MNQIFGIQKTKPALSSGNPSEKISLAAFHRWCNGNRLVLNLKIIRVLVLSWLAESDIFVINVVKFW